MDLKRSLAPTGDRHRQSACSTGQRPTGRTWRRTCRCRPHACKETSPEVHTAGEIARQEDIAVGFGGDRRWQEVPVAEPLGPTERSRPRATAAPATTTSSRAGCDDDDATPPPPPEPVLLVVAPAAPLKPPMPPTPLVTVLVDVDEAPIPPPPLAAELVDVDEPPVPPPPLATELLDVDAPPIPELCCPSSSPSYRRSRCSCPRRNAGTRARWQRSPVREGTAAGRSWSTPVPADNRNG